ncbi:MAG: alpha-glucosidase, partial [Muribaculaceae bacterium]|nr:alpha-glucosidase [Muribaculaceae bacterium]
MIARKIAMACAVVLVANAQAVETEVSFVSPTIVKISRVPDPANPGADTGVCLPGLPSLPVNEQNTGKGRRYASDSLVVCVAENGAVSFADARTGRVLLAEDASQPVVITPVVRENVIYDDATARVEDTANGQVTVKAVLRRDTIGTDYAYALNLDFGNPGALYGLGSHIEGYMNLLGKTLHLTQHNLKASVPVLVSPAGYGVLVDAGCAMKFSSDSVPGGYTGKMELDAADRLDYYFIKGARLDDVVAGYRALTGAVSMMPRHLFGYTQSKERYTSQHELIDVASEYRRRGLPLDMIVQDWNYWPEGWGYMKMDERFYPDPAALADSLHAMDVKLMVSIWPNPQGCPQERDFRERGYMLPNSVYDAFNPDARRHYWEYADKEFFSRGFDAWWCDSSEPVDGDWNQLPPPV